MAKFPFMVKHNGILYQAGQEVPIGIEAKKENRLEDKTATEIKNELKEVYGITKFPKNSKVALLEQLIEAKANAEAVKKEEEEEELEEAEVEETEEETNEEESESFLDKIINEE